MNYTKRERKEIAEAFRAAKKYLWDGRGGRGYKHICYALEETYLPKRDYWDTIVLAKGIVASRIYPHLSVETWLIEKKLIDKYNHDRAMVQQYRHAWLDALIKEFNGVDHER